MNIKVNGKDSLIESGSLSIAQLLIREKVENPQMVSVQRNGEFVDKSNFADTLLREGDEVDFVYFMGGGRGKLNL